MRPTGALRLPAARYTKVRKTKAPLVLYRVVDYAECTSMDEGLAGGRHKKSAAADEEARFRRGSLGSLKRSKCRLCNDIRLDVNLDILPKASER